MKHGKKHELLSEFIETYDEKARELKQLKFLKMVDIVLLVFVIIIFCMVSVRL